jgi:hypothetical protein
MQRLIDGQAAVNVLGFISTIPYPARKDQVVHAARRNGAPNEIVEELQRIPQTDFQTAQDVLEAYGKLA